ncbi:hypothetical protein [Mycolicibacter heraklionensis]|uniref:hypothetical protein n=1 Tax=Mycolicibacter heraklionensis TaxID=512402 RepID=UPI0007E9A404|nr:hypothetical protein [Mycolicibacter heraklionensis]OBG32399.1 hypothetical protein A5671_07655 [Mycolicibacter heraklionensis]
MTHHPTDPGLIAQGGSEAAGTDILARAKSRLAEISDDPMLVHLLNAGDVVGILHDLTAEVERLRGALDRIKSSAESGAKGGLLVCEAIHEYIEGVLRGDQ